MHNVLLIQRQNLRYLICTEVFTDRCDTWVHSLSQNANLENEDVHM